jgi:hypothetical protein
MKDLASRIKKKKAGEIAGLLPSECGFSLS